MPFPESAADIWWLLDLLTPYPSPKHGSEYASCKYWLNSQNIYTSSFWISRYASPPPHITVWKVFPEKFVFKTSSRIIHICWLIIKNPFLGSVAPPRKESSSRIPWNSWAFLCILYWLSICRIPALRHNLSNFAFFRSIFPHCYSAVAVLKNTPAWFHRSTFFYVA